MKAEAIATNGALAILAVVAAFVIGRPDAAGDGVIRCRAIEVVDRHGHVVVSIGLDSLGEPGIATADCDGQPLVVFGEYRNSGMVSVFDGDGRVLTLAGNP